MACVAVVKIGSGYCAAVRRSSLYQPFHRAYSERAVTFATLPLAARILSNFYDQKYWFRIGEMQI